MNNVVEQQHNSHSNNNYRGSGGVGSMTKNTGCMHLENVDDEGNTDATLGERRWFAESD